MYQTVTTMSGPPQVQQKIIGELGMVGHACDPNSQEDEAGVDCGESEAVFAIC